MNSRDFYSDKIVSPESIADRLSRARTGRTVISTNGCFDILHPGHIKFLENAKSLGDILVVAINSDSSVKTIKGESRPIINQELRSYALASLIFTDYIIIFEETTPDEILGLIRPDIHTKGEEYKKSGISEQQTVESHGGKVVYLPIVEGISTTAIIKQLKQ